MTTKLLANQLRGILSDPVEGFTVELSSDSLFDWKVFIEGPKDTCYEGGVFQLSLNFPKDYPMSPPVLKFVSDFWHPNVYHDGKVCMSILHPPGEDAMSGELAEERWLPTQSVTTIVLSLMSLLNDPNCSSPANVDASVEWRKNREGFIKKCQKLVEKANKEKPPHIVIPHPDTNEDEHKRVVQKWKEMNKDLDYEDFYEANDNEDDEDDEEDDEDEDESDENEDEDELLESNSEMKEDEDDEGEVKKESESKAKEPEIVVTTTSTTIPPVTSEPATSSSSPSPRHSTNLKLVVDESGSSSGVNSKNNDKDKEIVEDISGSSAAGPSNSNNNSNNKLEGGNSNSSLASEKGSRGKKKKAGTKSNKKKCTIM